MIQQLSIANFQSHKDTTLAFDPGLNVIVGPTDCGKTAVIRALRWLIWNRPMGEAFRSTWGGDTEVEITTDDERRWVIRRAKGSNNEYHKVDLDATGSHRVFKALVIFYAPG